MSETNSTAPGSLGKPTKPRPDFPLFPHATGRWAKKINGKTLYFGPWNDPDGALRRYEEYAENGEAPEALSVRRPRKRRRDATHTEAPSKPYPEFPLFAHATGRWAKKIRGKLYYFGPWDDPDGALDSYDSKKEALYAGRKPRAAAGTLTIKELVNEFLATKEGAVDAGELTHRSYQDYKDACDLLKAHFDRSRLLADIGPDDFAALRRRMTKKGWGPVTLGNVIQRVRVVFKYASDNDLIDRPVRYGQAFKRPSRKTIRLDKAKKGAKLFTADEVRKLLNAAGPVMRAMVYLGINCGFGNSDCGNLPASALDLDRGWITYPRPKTGIARRCHLWPETSAAIKEAMAKRPTPKDEAHAGLVFITKYGLPWAKDTADQTLAKEFGKLLRSLHINGRKGLGFYTLRHTFRTVADEAKDQIATDHIMGHEIQNMSAAYRETISDARLQAVSEYVRTWLHAKPAAAPTDMPALLSEAV